MNFSTQRLAYTASRTTDALRVPVHYATPAPARALPRPAVLSAGDRMLQRLVWIAMILEIVVFIEPAPVDAVLMVCLVAALLAGKVNFSALTPGVSISIGLFALLNIVSMYDPFNPIRAVTYVAVTLYLVASWFLFTGLIGRYGTRLMRQLIDAYAIAGLISALLGIVGYFHLVPFADTLLLNGRARGLFKDCNVYGPFFVPMALFALVRALDSSKPTRERVWQGVLASAAVVAILLSFSRACWLNFGLALAIVLAGQTARQKMTGLVGKAAILTVAGIAVALLLNVPEVHSMMTMRVNSDHLQDYDRVRFATQSLALESAKTHPFGIGPGQSEEVFDYATHSLYLRILTENGLGALVALLFFIGATLSRCWTLMRSAADPWIRDVGLIVFGCICGHFANSFVIDTVHWRNIWFIYALPWVMVPLQRRIRTLAATPRFGAGYPRANAPGLAQI
jgi:O-antigen ligase